MPGGDEHRVEAGALELEHLVAVADVDVRDRELPGRHVGEQLERELERIARRRTGEMRKISGSCSSSADSSSSSSRTSMTVSSSPWPSSPSGLTAIASASTGIAAASQRTGRLVESRMPSIARSTASAFAPCSSRRARRRRVADPDDDRDPVTFRDPLAQTSSSPAPGRASVLVRSRIQVDHQSVPGRLPAVRRAEPDELVVREAVHLLDVREDGAPRRERASCSSAWP